jgi:hypothetical protein
MHTDIEHDTLIKKEVINELPLSKSSSMENSIPED